MRDLTALIAGIVFGVGLTLSQMINPAKVIGFLDLFGTWDASLAFVMIGALIVTALGYRLVTGTGTLVFADKFHITANQTIDFRLALGSLLFGVGWGLVGLCPGPAIAALTIGGLPVLVFLFAMLAGAYLFQFIDLD